MNKRFRFIKSCIIHFFTFTVFALTLGLTNLLYYNHRDSIIYEFRNSNKREFRNCAWKNECSLLLEKWHALPVNRACLVVGKAQLQNSSITEINCKQMDKTANYGVFSSSKWVSSALIWSFIEKLNLTYDVSTSILDPEWQTNMQLSDLIGLRSGLRCENVMSYPKQDFKVGTVFEYCGQNFDVALQLVCNYARKDKFAILNEYTFDGMTFHSQLLGTRLDVSLVTSVEAYAHFLAKLTNGSIVSPDLLTKMHEDVLVVADPFREYYFGYAQGNWKEVKNVSSSMGYGGFVPWWDHDYEYFGIVSFDYVYDFLVGPFLVSIFVLIRLNIQIHILKSII